ncbi:DUF3307 domain-containing protein [Salinisphaera sp.]|uniref:DUF3307 domain-containing protein n=1 Tax=Salinisphaera sp. TaxID=1914330 RepID=UPI002D76E99D|nr:DUF3307 domain-containing protein [Salinisphaera sp.]HET7313922.1 DUF3307 domain-containing protein [Salinisphaera sp.]
MMLKSLVALVFAHVLADFLFQTRGLVVAKHRPTIFALHIGCVAITAALALGAASLGAWAAVALVAGSHGIIDACKIHPRVAAWAAMTPFGSLRLFAIDQVAHLTFVAIAAVLWPHAFSAGLWPILLGGSSAQFLSIGFALAGGFWLATRAGDLMLAQLMLGFHSARAAGEDRVAGEDRATSEDKTGSPQLPGAGAWIGWLERTLVFLFVLLGQFNAIGFVIAAKSILRFRYTREPRVSEIVIIGTLASFGWAIIVALLVHAALVGFGV